MVQNKVSEVVSMATSRKKQTLMERVVQKCGIRVHPPTFLIIYQVDGKLRKKIMPLRNFKTSSNVEFVANDLKKRHGLEEVPLVKVEKLLRLLQELLDGSDKFNAIEKVENEFKIKLNEDLNKLSTHEIEMQKKLMDSLFQRNQIKKDDEGFEYDKRIDFTDEKEESPWDLDTDNNFWD